MANVAAATSPRTASPRRAGAAVADTAALRVAGLSARRQVRPTGRLQYPTRAFDRVAALSVEGVSKAAIARLEGMSWATVARWLERAAHAAGRFNDAHTQASLCAPSRYCILTGNYP